MKFMFSSEIIPNHADYCRGDLPLGNEDVGSISRPWVKQCSHTQLKKKVVKLSYATSFI